MMKFKPFVISLFLLLVLTRIELWSQTYTPEYYLSGAMPVLYVTTADGQKVTSKEEYKDAFYYLDANGIDGYKSFGSAEQPLPMQIKGRGNMTWAYFPKKPFHIKLESKAALLGMHKNKHFGLMAHVDRDVALFQSELGYELSRYFGMEWTPTQKPVELVLNGGYRGLYFLSELVRVDSKRVNILEQKDGETDPYMITGGWLVEIDNYVEEDDLDIFLPQSWRHMRLAVHTPELLSPEQEEYITQTILKMDKAINTKDSTSTEWEELFDVESAVRYYLVNEIMFDIEAYSGSCFFYKDLGEDTKFKFGPVWDFGFSLLSRSEEHFIYQDAKNNFWIKQLNRFTHFQELVKTYFAQFLVEEYPKMDAFIDDFAQELLPAIGSEYMRWPQFQENEILERADMFKYNLHKHVSFLASQWCENPYNPDMVDVATVNHVIDIVLGIAPPNPSYDLNYDGLVDVNDVNTIIGQVLSSPAGGN